MVGYEKLIYESLIDGTQLLLPFVKIIKYLLGYGVTLVETQYFVASQNDLFRTFSEYLDLLKVKVSSKFAIVLK